MQRFSLWILAAVLAIACPGFIVNVESATRQLVYGRRDGTDARVYFANPDGTGETFITAGAHPRLSGNERYLAFVRDGNLDSFLRNQLYVRDLIAGTETHLFPNPDYVVSFDWAPDNLTLLYDYSCEVDRINPDGTGAVRVFQVDCYDDAPASNP